MKLLNEAQVEQLKEISQKLLQVRQEKSIRIEEVAAKTHIRLAFLQALEAGQFEELPEPVYIQGFIRRYADLLGLDGTALANTFTINSNIIPLDTNNNINNERQKSDIRPNKPNIHIPLFVPYVVLLVLASIGLIYVLNPKLIVESLANQLNRVSVSKKTAPSPVGSSPTAASVTQQQNSVPTPKQEIAPSPAPSQSTINPDVEVTLELQDKSWLRVIVDGKTEFEGDLKKGDRKTWTAKKQLTVRSGNAGAVLISVNKQAATPLGNQGAVKEVTFTPEGNSQ